MNNLLFKRRNIISRILASENEYDGIPNNIVVDNCIVFPKDAKSLGYVSNYIVNYNTKIECKFKYFRSSTKPTGYIFAKGFYVTINYHTINVIIGNQTWDSEILRCTTYNFPDDVNAEDLDWIKMTISCSELQIVTSSGISENITLTNKHAISSSYTCNNKLRICACEGGSSGDMFEGKMYYVKIYEGDTLVKNYIPAHDRYLKFQESRDVYLPVTGFYDNDVRCIFDNGATLRNSQGGAKYVTYE